MNRRRPTDQKQQNLPGAPASCVNYRAALISVGVGNGRQIPPPKREKYILSGKYHVKFEHFRENVM